MRGTIHLVSAGDCLGMHPLTQPLLNRIWRSAWQKRLNGAPVEEVAAAGRELLAERPRPRAELQRLLAPRWPESEPLALAYAVTFMLPLVQVAPRGQWRASAQACGRSRRTGWARRSTPSATVDDLVRRYLAAFGPATVSDMRTWCGLNGLRGAFERLRPELRTFRDERGRELFDVHDGPFPTPRRPAPPALPPEYDNLLLSPRRPLPRAGRARAGAARAARGPGSARCSSTASTGRSGVRRRRRHGHPAIDRFTPHADDPAGLGGAIVAEGEHLLAFVAPGATPPSASSPHSKPLPAHDRPGFGSPVGDDGSAANATVGE